MKNSSELLISLYVLLCVVILILLLLLSGRIDLPSGILLQPSPFLDTSSTDLIHLP